MFEWLMAEEKGCPLIETQIGTNSSFSIVTPDQGKGTTGPAHVLTAIRPTVIVNAQRSPAYSNPNIPLFNCCSICILCFASISNEILCGLPP